MDLLPRRHDDGLTGELRFKLYQAKLGHVSAAGMSFLTSVALERCDWFPSIAQCLAILAEWSGENIGVKRREQAAFLVAREMQQRLDEALAAMKRREIDQSGIDDLPDHWKRIAAEKGYLWRWPDGRFTVKPDADAMSEDERAAHRAEVAAMMAEWDRISAGQDLAV